jgi:hypothetical protein
MLYVTLKKIKVSFAIGFQKKTEATAKACRGAYTSQSPHTSVA